MTDSQLLGTIVAGLVVFILGAAQFVFWRRDQDRKEEAAGLRRDLDALHDRQARCKAEHDSAAAQFVTNDALMRMEASLKGEMQRLHIRIDTLDTDIKHVLQLMITAQRTLDHDR